MKLLALQPQIVSQQPQSVSEKRVCGDFHLWPFKHPFDCLDFHLAYVQRLTHTGARGRIHQSDRHRIRPASDEWIQVQGPVPTRHSIPTPLRGWPTHAGLEIHPLSL